MYRAYNLSHVLSSVVKQTRLKNRRKIRPFKFQFSHDKSRRDKEKDPGVRAQESQFMLLREGQIDFAPEIMVNQKLMETLPQVGSLINFEICTAFLSDTS